MTDPDAVVIKATPVGPDGVLTDREVVVRGSKIEQIRPASAGPYSGYVLPGLVDTHVHGALGQTFNELAPGPWLRVLDAHLAAGTTALLATLMTDSLDRLHTQLRVGRALLAAAEPQSPLLGLHLEGPYLAVGYRGAHSAELLVTPADGSWRALVPHFDTIRMITLAPELNGALDLIVACTGAGVVTSVGHSGADPDVFAAAQVRGLRHAAHLWSGQSMLRKHGPWRHPGLLEAVLSSDDGTAELIADGRHLPAALVRIAYRCLGPERLCLVSDASAGTGLAAGTTFAMGETTGVVADGTAVSSDGASFCGSTSYLLDTLRFAVRDAGIPLVDAVRMAATTPARLLGLAHRLGSLSPGMAADLVVVTEELTPIQVMKAGRWVQAGVAVHA